MFSKLLLISTVLLAPAPENLIQVDATIEAGRPGRSEIVLTYSVLDGYAASEGGIPAPILQIDVPDGVKLDGKVLTAHKELAHQQMFELPPGSRGALDYIVVPTATWTDPQLLNEDLQHSVWGSTFATVWFDGHRYFLPQESPAVTRLGTAVLLLAILPTLAFAVGLVAGIRRAWQSFETADTPLLLTVLLTLAGFALFTYRNPWYAVIKGTSLLALCLPFSFYASEVLARWTRRPGLTGPAIGFALVALALAVTATSTFDLLFEKTEVPGLPWEELRDE